jgi:hypothetical protein
MPIPVSPPATYAENGAGRVTQPASHTPDSTPVVPVAAPKAALPAITCVEFAAAVKDALRDVHSTDLLARNCCCATDFAISAGQPARRS